jgi:hypothetical protein
MVGGFDPDLPLHGSRFFIVVDVVGAGNFFYRMTFIVQTLNILRS